ncbi:MAG: T9SS type A sorting domain-containing protein [Thermotogae bacterium]|nr:T9SS type A sorting domain-containing protein [Thermotogota bacterium]
MAPNKGGASYTPFSVTELVTGQSGHYWTNLRNGPRPLLVRGDTIIYVHRQLTTTLLHVHWSFDGGATWNDVDSINAALGRTAWYPVAAGVTSDGNVVVIFPSSGSDEICAVEVSTTNIEGACDASIPYGDYAHFAWQIGPDMFAIITNDTSTYASNASFYYLTYDASTNTFSSPVVLKDGNLLVDFTFFEAHPFGDSVLVVGSSENATTWGEPGDWGYFWVRSDGTTRGSPDAAPIFDGYLSMYLVTVGATAFIPNTYINIQTHTALGPDGRVWVLYGAADTAFMYPNWNTAAQSSHMIVVHNDTLESTDTLFFFYAANGSEVNLYKTVTWPIMLFGDSPNDMVIVWTQYDSTDAPACGAPPDEANLNFPSKLYFARTTDGGQTWCTDSLHIPGNFFSLPVAPNVNGFGNRLIGGDTVLLVYASPQDGVTDPFCHLMYAFNNWPPSAWPPVDLHVVKFPAICSGDPTGDSVGILPVTSVAEKPVQKVGPVTVEVLKGGVKTSGPANIYDIKGSLVASTDGGFVSLKSGIYFVKAGNRVSKVVIK